MRHSRIVPAIQLGDRVVILLESGRFTGEVVSRGADGRLLVKLDCHARGVHLHVDHRRVRKLPSVLRVPASRKPSQGRFAG
jgi:hypothetical protein